MAERIWVEKYRPKELEDVVLSEETAELFGKYIYDKSLPHVLFYGPPGSGKCHHGDEIIEIYIDD